MTSCASEDFRVIMPKESQTFLWHPKEWIVWLLFFASTTTFRALHHMASSEIPFEGAVSQESVMSDLQSVYCPKEVTYLCTEPRPWERCSSVYGHRSDPFRAVDATDRHSSNPSGTENCTLLAMFPTHVAVPGQSTKETEMRLVVERMIYKFQWIYSLWGKEDDGIHAGPWIELFLARFYCLLVYQPGSWETSESLELEKIFRRVDREAILMSDPKEWTTQEFLQMVNAAVTETEQSLLRGVDNEIKVQRQENTVIDIGEEVEPGAQERLLKVNHASERKSQDSKTLLRFLESLAKSQNSFEERVLETANSGDHVCLPVMIRSEHKKWHWMFFSDNTNMCMMLNFHRQDSLLSNRCQEAIQLAQLKLEELDLEETAGFLTIFHVLFFGTNLVSFLVLFTLLNSKQRLERKMDRRRRQLEQELNDPFLRQSLECRAACLPEYERQQLIPRLEAKVTSWDSKAAVSRLLRRYVRRFRHLVVLTFVVTTLLYLILHLFRCSSLPRYLEMAMMSTAIMAASYWISYGVDCDTNKKPLRPAEISMQKDQDLQSCTQVLLSNNDDDEKLSPSDASP